MMSLKGLFEKTPEADVPCEMISLCHKHKMLRRMRKCQLSEPAAIRLGPLRPWKRTSMTQEITMQLLALLTQVPHCLRPHAHQITHRFVRLVGTLTSVSWPTRNNWARIIAPVGLHLVAGFPRDQRRRNNVTAVAQRCKPIQRALPNRPDAGAVRSC